MSYKIPEHPTIRAYSEEIADFWEVQALLHPQQYISARKIASILSIGSDELQVKGIESEDDEVEPRLQEAYQELVDRQKFTSNNYPFKFKKTSIQLEEKDSFKKYLYSRQL